MKYELRSTKQYDKWLARLKDSTVKIRILARLARVENGNFGDFKQIGPSLFELRFFFGAGLRIYYTIQDQKVISTWRVVTSLARKGISKRRLSFCIRWRIKRWHLKLPPLTSPNT